MNDVIRAHLTVLRSCAFCTVGQADCDASCAAHGLPVGRLFTHRFAFEDAAEAYLDRPARA